MSGLGNGISSIHNIPLIYIKAIILLALMTSFPIENNLVIFYTTNIMELADKKGTKLVDIKMLANIEGPANIKEFVVIYYKYHY